MRNATPQNVTSEVAQQCLSSIIIQKIFRGSGLGSKSGRRLALERANADRVIELDTRRYLPVVAWA